MMELRRSTHFFDEKEVRNMSYGISRWDDPEEINAKLKSLTSQGIWEVNDDYYNNVVLKYFDEKCKASKAVF